MGLVSCHLQPKFYMLKPRRAYKQFNSTCGSSGHTKVGVGDRLSYPVLSTNVYDDSRGASRR